MGAHPSLMKMEELLEREELGLVRSPTTGRVRRKDNVEYCPEFNSTPRVGSRVRVRDYAGISPPRRGAGEGCRSGGSKELRRGHAWSGLDSMERLFRARRGIQKVRHKGQTGCFKTMLALQGPGHGQRSSLVPRRSLNSFLDDPFLVEQACI